jgi:hypothetical protein
MTRVALRNPSNPNPNNGTHSNLRVGAVNALNHSEFFALLKVLGRQAD